MKVLKNIVQGIISLTAWISGVTTFAVAGSVVLVASLFIDPRRFDRLIKAACRLIMRALFVRVSVTGAQHLDLQRTYLFMSNHVNLFDVFVLYGHVPHSFRGVELEDHFNWFFYGRIIKAIGMIPISQTRARSALQSLEKAQQALDAGTSILILPEGGRTLTGRLAPFKRGTFYLAKAGRVDVAPMMMIDAFRINRKGSLLIRPGRMTLAVAPPIPYDEIKELPVEAIKALVFERMAALSEEERKQAQTVACRPVCAASEGL